MKRIIFIIGLMMISLSAAAMGALSDDIILSYTFDNADLSGSNPTDVTGNGFDGVNYGATTGVSGRINEAFDFDGSSDYINVTIAGFPATPIWTAAIWIDADVLITANKYQIMSIRDSTPLFQMHWQSDQLRFFQYTTPCTATNVSFTDTSGWHLVVFGYDGTNTWLNLDNGSATDTDACALGDIDADANIFLGADGNPAYTQFWDGQFDSYAIWNKTLSASEISEVYANRQYPFSAETLVFYDQSPANASEYAYSSTGQSLGFDFNITGGSDMYTCNLTRNGSLISSNGFNATLEGTFTLYDTYSTELNYTEYEYGVICTQGATTITDTNKTIYIMVDSAQPYINFLYPTDGYVINLTPASPDLTVQVAVNDSNLYNSTFTLYYENGSVVNTTNVFHNLTATYYQWNFTQDMYTLPSQTYNMSVQSCDGHTKQIIDEWEDVSKADGSIIFGDCRIYPDALMKDIGEYYYTYEGDRYTWTYEWLRSDTTRSYFLECAPGSDIAYLPQSEYKGHFVEYSTRRWLDFETAEDYPTTVTKLTGNKWRITYTGVDNSIVTTRSIGELNCNNASITFDVLSKSDMTFNYQDPADITNTNIFAQRVNITYNITDTDGVNTSILYWKTNTTSVDGATYINGSLIEGYSVGLTAVSNVSLTWQYLLSDNAVLPGIYNIYEEYMEDEPSLYHNLSSPSQYAAVELIGVSSAKTYNVLELSIDNESATSTVADIYYCNSSYGFSMTPVSSSACALVYTMTGDEPYNHSDDKLVPLAISGGELNGVAVTSVSYIVIGPSGVDTWQWRYISNVTRADTSRYSTDAGASWSNLSGTFDAHLHQYSGSDTFYYIASAQDDDGDWTNSTVRSDLLDLGGLPPADLVFTYPLGGETVGFGTDMPIDWTDAISPNGYDIAGYNLTLYYSNGSVYSQLADNISDSNYTYDTSTALEDDFYLEVIACDNITQCTAEQSGVFSIADVNGTASVSVNDTTPYVNESVVFTWNYSDNNPDSVLFELNCSNTTVYTNTTSYTGTYTYSYNTTGTCTGWLWGNDTLGGEWTDSASAVFSEEYISATGNFTVGSCPNTDTPTMMMYGLMLMFAFALIMMGWTMRVPFMTMLGGVCLLILSWYVAGCIPLIGFVMAGAGLLMIAWSMLKVY